MKSWQLADRMLRSGNSGFPGNSDRNACNHHGPVWNFVTETNKETFLMFYRKLIPAVMALAIIAAASSCTNESTATDTSVAGASSASEHKNHQEEGPSKVILLSDANFESIVLKSDKPVLVDFYADWCGPCRMLAPTIAELAKEYDGKVLVGKVNVDHSQRTSGKYSIRSLPTLIIFKDGKPAKKLVGFQSKKALMAALNEFAR